jgi:hypothetical protein
MRPLRSTTYGRYCPISRDGRRLSDSKQNNCPRPSPDLSSGLMAGAKPAGRVFGRDLASGYDNGPAAGPGGRGSTGSWRAGSWPTEGTASRLRPRTRSAALMDAAARGPRRPAWPWAKSGLRRVSGRCQTRRMDWTAWRPRAKAKRLSGCGSTKNRTRGTTGGTTLPSSCFAPARAPACSGLTPVYAVCGGRAVLRGL